MMNRLFISIYTYFLCYSISNQQIKGQFNEESYDTFATLMDAMERMQSQRGRYPLDMDEDVWNNLPKSPIEKIVVKPEEKELKVDIGDGRPGSEADVLKSLKLAENKIEKKSPEVIPFAAPMVQKNPIQMDSRSASLSDATKIQLIVVASAFCAVAAVGLVVGATYVYKRKQKINTSKEGGNPIGELKGQNTGGQGDRKLAQSAQMYHYQHQKQQMIALEKASNEIRPEGSDEDSEPENEEGDYTVYECPGLAPTGELEVRNPMFTGGENLIQIENETEKSSSSKP